MARSRWLVGAVIVVALVSGCGGGGDDGGGEVTTHALTVSLAGAGSGTVTSSPAGISCSSGSCSADFAVDTTVVLTASPGVSSTFAGWSGAGCAGGGTCTVIVGGDLAVTATFDAVPPVTHALEVIIAGAGLGTVVSSPPGIDCAAGTCTADFTEGAQVTLSAAPVLDGSIFAGWAGACSGEASSVCILTMSGDLSATATFDPPPVMHSLSVTVTGPGSGSVTSSPPGISCSSGTCNADFAEGTEVVLTATPAPTGGAFFAGWSGACAGAGTGPCTLTMDGDRAATATFSTQQTVNLTIVGDGVGTVTSDPAGISCTSGSTTGCSASFVTGTTVTLTGTAAPGSSFYGWSPTCDASPDPCVFELGSTADLTARFTAWTVRRPFPTNVEGIAALGSTLVAVGAGAVATSADGLAWTGHELASTAQLRDVAADAGGTTAVAVGAAGLILSTGDAVTWTPRASGTSLTLNAVAQGGGVFVAVGDDGAIVASTDGASWSPRTSNTPYDLLAVAYGGSTFVAVGFGGTILTSADGQDWAKPSSPTTQYLTGVAYDASSGFVAVGNAGHVLTSADGGSWALQIAALPLDVSVVVRGVAARAGIFVAVDSAHAVHRSTTGGESWNSYAGAEDLEGSTVTGIGAAGDAFYAMSDGGMARAADGTGWVRVLTLGPNVYAMAYGNSTYVLVGHGAIFTSPDGAVWTSRFAGNPYARATDMVSSVVYGNGTFIAVSGHGILGSDDGITWATVGPAPADYGGVVAYGGTAGFAVASASGSASEIWTSPDGATWTKQTGAGIAAPLIGIAFGASTFVAVGGAAGVSAIYSNPTPGTTAPWTPQSSPVIDHVLGSLLFGGTTFAASDSQTGQDSITSTNAVSWLGPHHADSWMGRLVAFGDGVFLSQTLLTSSNGVNWSPMANRPPGMTYVYAGTHDGPDGWVITDGRAFAVHP